MFRFVNRLYAKKISSKGLAIFRILFSLNLFFEVLHIFKHKELYYDPIPFLERNYIDFGIPLVVWMCVLVFLIVGKYTRVSAILNYIFIVFFLSPHVYFEYHMDYAYAGIGFLMILFPIAQSYSLDNLGKRLKYSNTKQFYKPEDKVSVLYYYILIFLGIGIVYLDSIYAKVNSESWMNGLGLWMPASLPQVTLIAPHWLLNQKYLVLFLGYLTFVFEIIFPLFFWVKRLRILFAIIGVGLHIGIFLIFPIPYFGLGVTALYVLLLPNRYWEWVTQKLKFKQPKLVFFYDNECPLCARTKTIIQFFDFFGAVDFKSVQVYGFEHEALQDISKDKLLADMHTVDGKGTVRVGVDSYRKAFMYIPLFFVLGLLLYVPGIYHLAKRVYQYVAKNRELERCTEESCGYTPPNFPIASDDILLLKNLKVQDLRVFGLKFLLLVVVILQLNGRFGPATVGKITNVSESFGKAIEPVQIATHGYATKLLGITPHGVFVDGHFQGQDYIHTLTYNGDMLPMIQENGQPGKYLRGGSWVNYVFRVDRPFGKSDSPDLEKGLIRYSAFWLHKNGLGTQNAEFDLIRKNVKVAFEWEKDRLKNNLAKPWKKIGKLVWKDNKASLILY
ncbi:DCC1-like thiol-disulfide oxidoreductase family protein [Pseudotenacibaculum haliotis]|uniref:DCC1-like thiol-disulfide oxidoreductase family protein n=1 Tax=Pseudotenacibaculum haliotis TaxID=1862138 RepID=A0ABW5LTQ1_9FLAO